MTEHLAFYKVLGLSNNRVSQEEIKKAYLKNVKEYHPDVNNDPFAHEIFTQITEAYETLKDEEKRKVYDKYGLAPASTDDASLIEAAEVNLVDLWNQVIDAIPVEAIDRMDIGHLMRNSVVETRQGLDNDQKKEEKKIQKLEKVILKVKYTGPNKNLLQDSVNKRLSNSKSNLQSIAKRIRILDKLTEILLVYDFDKPMTQQTATSTTRYNPGGVNILFGGREV